MMGYMLLGNWRDALGVKIPINQARKQLPEPLKAAEL
jgi:hypothetical protein